MRERGIVIACVVSVLIMGCVPKISEDAQKTMEAISEIGSVTDESSEKISIARKLYENLSDEEKEQVNNVDTLEQAEEDYSQIITQVEIDNCISAINEIGKVTLDSGKSIKKAEKLYSKLDADAKNLVTNYQKLVKAKKKLTSLEEKKAEKERELAIGDSFASGSMNITLDDAQITKEVWPENRASAMYSIVPADGQVLVDLKFTMTYKISNGPAIASGLSDMVVTCGSYTYSEYELYYDEGYDLQLTLMNGEYDAFEALDPWTVHLMTNVPQTAIDRADEVVVDVKILGKDKRIVLQK